MEQVAATCCLAALPEYGCAQCTAIWNWVPRGAELVPPRPVLAFVLACIMGNRQSRLATC